jgi:hypothetical protein
MAQELDVGPIKLVVVPLALEQDADLGWFE